jgi:hypothetical protein
MGGKIGAVSRATPFVGYGLFRSRFACQRMIHCATETLSAAIE